MNEENNLNNVTTEVPNPTPVETPTPLETPTSVEPAPVAEPTPFEPTPVEPAPVAEPTQVEAPAPEVAPVENPAPVAEPTPAPTPEPVVAPTPVEPTVNPAPVAESTPSGKKSNPVLVILLVIALFVLLGYVLYTYTDIFKGKTKTSGGETTTTTEATTTTATSKLAFASVEEYVTAAKVSGDEKKLIIDSSNALTELNFDMANKCKADGDAISFEIGSNKIEYSCKKAEYDEAVCGDYWTTTVKVNDKFTKEYSSCTECAVISTYVNKNLYLDVTEEGCAVSVLHNKFKLYDSEGKNVGESTYGTYFSTKEDFSDQVLIRPIVKDNVLYFMSGDSTQTSSSTCRLKYIDLNASSPSIVDSGISSACTIDE